MIVLPETTPVAILAMLIASSCGVFAATRTVFFKKRITELVWEGGVAFLTADGISFGRYSWEQIHDAEYARFGGNARLVGHGGPTVDRIGQACFASDRQTKAFIEIVNRCRKKSRGEDAAPSVEVDGERVIQSGYRR